MTDTKQTNGKRLITAAMLVVLLLAPLANASAHNIQMLPPVDESTTSPCTSGTSRILTWDGDTPIACANGVTASGGNITASGTIGPGSFKVGSACAAKGTFGYDPAGDAPVYCNQQLVWEAVGGAVSASTTMTSSVAVPDNTAAATTTENCATGYYLSGCSVNATGGNGTGGVSVTAQAAPSGGTACACQGIGNGVAGATLHCYAYCVK